MDANSQQTETPLLVPAGGRGVQAVMQQPAAAKESVLLETATVKGVAGEEELKLGRVINITGIRPAELWILRAPRCRVLLEALSRSQRHRATSSCWVKGRLRPSGLANNARGEKIQMDKLPVAL